jgi:hypothetical protein
MTGNEHVSAGKATTTNVSKGRGVLIHYASVKRLVTGVERTIKWARSMPAHRPKPTIVAQDMYVRSGLEVVCHAAEHWSCQAFTP